MSENRHTSHDAFNNPANCVCYRLRRAARLTAKTVDCALKPTGLRNTQLALLGALIRSEVRHGGSSIGDLSETLATDGTTLTRNIEVLIRRGLVEDVAADDARVRIIEITDLGKETYMAAVPLWREAQKQILQAIGPERWSEMEAELDKIEKACA